MESKEQINYLDKIKQLQEEKQFLRKLATSSGFFSLYYSLLHKFKTNLECFNHLNDRHFEEFGIYKYSSYQSFNICKNKKL